MPWYVLVCVILDIWIFLVRLKGGDIFCYFVLFWGRPSSHTRTHTFPWFCCSKPEAYCADEPKVCRSGWSMCVVQPKKSHPQHMNLTPTFHIPTCREPTPPTEKNNRTQHLPHPLSPLSPLSPLPLSPSPLSPSPPLLGSSAHLPPSSSLAFYPLQPQL